MRKIVNLTILFSLLIFISGCNQQTQSDVRAVSDETQLHENNLAAQSAPARYKAPHRTGKSHAAITMRYELLNTVALNQVLELKLSFNVGHDVESLRVEYFAEAGLSVINSQNVYVFNKISKDEAQTLLLSVRPELPGEHVINISATIETQAGSQSRSFEIPITLPAKNQPQPQTSKAHNTGRFIPDQNVISMPASKAPR